MDAKNVSKMNVTGVKKFFSELLMTFIATTMSIVLTFGTAELIQRYENRQAQRQMAMMILHDIDDSIDKLNDYIDILEECIKLQDQLREDNSLWNKNPFMFTHKFRMLEFNEYNEKIFSSSADIWSTLDNAVFIDNVSGCYYWRNYVKDNTYSSLMKDFFSHHEKDELDYMLNYDLPYYLFDIKVIALQLQHYNEQNKKIMNISEDDLAEFVKKRESAFDNQRYEDLYNTYLEEYTKAEEKRK